VVAASIQAIRDDHGGPDAGRVFGLDDATAARLATFFDVVACRDLVLVWKIDVDDNIPTLRLIRADHVE